MSILTIAKMGHPVLRRIAAKVEDPTEPDIARLAADMRETVEEIGASGIAAPQVFVEKRVVVYRIGAARIPAGSDLQPVPWTVMVNPEITPLTKDKVLVWERCLSIPGLHGKVPRYPRISIRYQTIEGANVEHELHFVDAPNDLCKRQLRHRSATLPGGAAWTTDVEFDAITAYFQAPGEDENFNVIRHERA